eukprot:jgi/Mesen1/9455/ME000627S08833
MATSSLHLLSDFQFVHKVCSLNSARKVAQRVQTPGFYRVKCQASGSSAQGPTNGSAARALRLSKAVSTNEFGSPAPVASPPSTAIQATETKDDVALTQPAVGVLGAALLAASAYNVFSTSSPYMEGRMPRNKKASRLALNSIKHHFPKAMEAEGFIIACAVRLFHVGFQRDNCIALVNTCRDEVCRLLVTLIDREFGMSFNMSGLGGLLNCGTTGLQAGMSHSPVFKCDTTGGPRERYVFFAFPHLSIGENGEVGSILRRGRGKPSSACGALIAIRNDLNNKVPDAEDSDNLEYTTLRHKVIKKATGVDGPSLVDVTKAALDVITEDLERLISKTVDPEKADYAVITGIQIHSSSLEPGEPFNIDRIVDYIAPGKMYAVVQGERQEIYPDVKQALVQWC